MVLPAAPDSLDGDAQSCSALQGAQQRLAAGSSHSADAASEPFGDCRFQTSGAGPHLRPPPPPPGHPDACEMKG
jgi:hypothetical protein